MLRIFCVYFYVYIFYVCMYVSIFFYLKRLRPSPPELVSDLMNTAAQSTSMPFSLSFSLFPSFVISNSILAELSHAKSVARSMQKFISHTSSLSIAGKDLTTMYASSF
jgi:hypothetical protein